MLGYTVHAYRRTKDFVCKVYFVRAHILQSVSTASRVVSLVSLTKPASDLNLWLQLVLDFASRV